MFYIVKFNIYRTIHQVYSKLLNLILFNDHNYCIHAKAIIYSFVLFRLFYLVKSY